MFSNKRILIINDDEALTEAIVMGLEMVGCECLTHVNCRPQTDAWVDADLVIWKMNSTKDLPLIARMMACKRLPLVVLGINFSTGEKVRTLDAGAIDFVDIPCSGLELLARIRAHIRKFYPLKSKMTTLICPGIPITLNRVSWETIYHGKECRLSTKEFDLLYFLLENSGRVCSKDEILRNVWGYSESMKTRTLDTHIFRLRERFPDVSIKTVRGIGYCLKANTL